MPDLLDNPVAKKSAKRAEKPQRQPTPDVSARKPMVVQIRGSDEWKGWIEELAAQDGDTVAKFFERLARRHAKEIGFRDMPKR